VNTEAQALLGYVYAVSGKKDHADDIVRKLQEKSNFRHGNESLMGKEMVPILIRQNRMGHSDARTRTTTWTGWAACKSLESSVRKANPYRNPYRAQEPFRRC
jgi:hypothetical protein